MSRTQPLEQLALAQNLVTALVEDVDDAVCRTQYSPELSPLGWHLGHCVYVECYWLHELVRGDASVTAPLHSLYQPPCTPKPERGRHLPPHAALLAWAHDLQAYNLHYLANLDPALAGHTLFHDAYLQHFLIQHYGQHYETMLMVLAQKALQETAVVFAVPQPISPQPPRSDRAKVPGGHHRFGGESPEAYDNELPQQQAELGSFAIGRFPVTHAEYLAFMHDGGYAKPGLWSEGGRDWRRRHPAIEAPEYWRLNADGHWFGIGIRGAYQLAAGEPVYGINQYEAEAYAKWAGGHLPHEYQWETACRLGLLEDTGRTWEWCRNAFHPYDGYRAFPNDEYSLPWFDGAHFTLKGGSLYTRPAVKRPSVRNFYQADKRHIFAGLRLVW